MKRNLIVVLSIFAVVLAYVGVSEAFMKVKGFDHEMHQSIDENCTACHDVESDNMALKESPCHACHQKGGENLDKGSEKDCSTCHVDSYTMKPASHQPGWTTAHGALAIQNGTESCSTCHTERYCVDCHNDRRAGANVNHSRAFILTHYIQATADPASCTTCHKPTFCGECHSK